jgi:hypothetical protein
MTHDDFFRFIDSSKVFRRFTLVITIWMTWKASQWGIEMATAWMATTKPGLEMAAVIGAVLAPLSLLQASVFKAFLADGKGI